MISFTIAFGALVAIFILNLSLGMYYGFGVRHYWFFELLHFLGGFFVTMLLYALFGNEKMALTGLAGITLCWEGLEFSIAHIRSLARYMMRKFRMNSVEFTWGDTALDVILNFAGAWVYLHFFR